MMNSQGLLFGRATFLTYIPLLSKATSDDQEPTPGHQVNEIIKLTYESEVICQDLVLWLNGRLKLNSVNIKLKVLRIIKHLVLEGHSVFKQILRRQSDEITNTSKLSLVLGTGERSQKHLIVRQEAEALLEILFDLDLDNENRTVHKKHDLIGMGPSATGKMIGFGNSLAPKASLTDAIYQSVSGIADKFTEFTTVKREVGSYIVGEGRLISDSHLNEIEIGFQNYIKMKNRPAEIGVEKSEMELINLYLQAPPRNLLSAIENFSNSIHKLNRRRLLDIVNEGLQESSDGVIFRHLLLIEAFIRSGQYNMNDLADTLLENLFSIYLGVKNPPISIKSKKILLTLEKLLPQRNEEFEQLRS